MHFPQTGHLSQRVLSPNDVHVIHGVFVGSVYTFPTELFTTAVDLYAPVAVGRYKLIGTYPYG